MTVTESPRRPPVLPVLELLIACSLVAVACGPDADPNQGGVAGATGRDGGGTGAGGGPANAQLSGTLVVGARYEDADEIATVRYDRFIHQYPDVDVQFREADFDAQAFLTEVASGDAPDVVQMDREIIGTYIAQGAIDPLETCIAGRSIDTGQYRAAALGSVTFGGQIYGIPQFHDTLILMLNDSVLEDAGVTPESIDTSDWDGLREANERLMARDGEVLTRIGFDPQLPDLLPLWAAANGGSLLDEDGTESRLEDPRVAEALDFAASLVTAHGSATEFEDLKRTGPGSAVFGEENQFTEDALAAMPMGQSYLEELAVSTPNEGISFRPFTDRSGNHLTTAGGTAWVIPSSANNKAAACEFARVVTLADTWYAAAKARADRRAGEGSPYTGTHTGNVAADERIFDELVSEATAGAFFPGVELALQAADSAITVPPNPAAEEFTRIWNEAVQRVLNDGARAADALAGADQAAQEALDRAR